MTLTQVAHLELPTPEGTFDLRAFEMSSGHVYLAMSMGDVGSEGPVLARVHSECLTGDSFRSLRCDCGVQLRGALRAISAEGRGVLVYATGHEGRGIGLVNKLRAYVAQDRGADTVDANLHLGLPVDDRDYTDAAEVLKTLGVRSVRLMTGNPAKVEGLQGAGIAVAEVRPLHVAAHHRNVSYLETKRARMGHVAPAEESSALHPHPEPGDLLGAIRPTPSRPYVAVKYTQSIDGRIATSKGDSKWISGEGERTISHALRARCDAVMVGIGTVLNDDPQLTVRMVEGASPIRVVLDSSLRIPLDAKVLDDEAATIVMTTTVADRAKVVELERRDVAVRVVAPRADGVYLPAALSLLRGAGIRSLLVEGGGRVITALLAARLVDRVIVACAPRILGSGIEGVGDLGTGRIMEGISLTDRCIRVLEDDVVMAWDVSFPEEDDEDSSTALGAGL
ncbi:MAG TPA: GTP cyclohydrolase II [Actinomycetota bacterium]|nr:GTP cyclohydrolase II [Actinomycetota bacterium]